MNKFLASVVVFVIPLFLVGIVYEVLLWELRESVPVEKVVASQQDHPALFMRRFLDQEYNGYKLRGIELRQPEILILGSSRVMQFREEYFTKSFYNAGGLIQNHQDLENFLTKEALPKNLLVGLDPWWFKKNNTKSATSWIANGESEIVWSGNRYGALRKLPAILSAAMDERADINYGASAQIANGGFRADGSMKIHDSRVQILMSENKFVDTETPQISKRIKKGLTSRFSLSEIDETQWQATLKLLSAVDKQTNLIVYLPPFTKESLQAFRTTPEQSYFHKFATNQMPGDLRTAGISFIDLETPTEYGHPDTYFMDGFHPSEVFVATQAKRHAQTFGDLIAVNTIQQMIDDRYCDLLFDKTELRNE